MGDHFEHVGYRCRPPGAKAWFYVDSDAYFSEEGMRGDLEAWAERGWQVERLYRRCEGEARHESL